MTVLKAELKSTKRICSSELKGFVKVCGRKETLNLYSKRRESRVVSWTIHRVGERVASSAAV